MRIRKHRLSLLLQLLFLLFAASAVMGETLNDRDPDKDYPLEDTEFCSVPIEPSPQIDFDVRTYDGLQPRMSFTSSEVYAYPSLGGQVKTKVTAVELSWLGLSVLSPNETKVDNTTQEDAFALHLLQHGGDWSPNKRFSRDVKRFLWELDYLYPEPRRPDLKIGHLSDGGILLLRTSPGWTWSNESDGLELLPQRPQEITRLDLCMTMEERCSVLRDFGATQYPSIENCTDIGLPQTLEEGIAQSKHYVDRISKICNDYYTPKYYERDFEKPAAIVQQSMWSSIMRFAGMGRQH
jgi:hypothetical protein